MQKILLSLFDHSGNVSRPYKENGWKVIQIDIKHGFDILTFNPIKFLEENTQYSTMPEIGIIAQPPCTDYALCGAKWFATKDVDGRTQASNALVQKTLEIIEFFDKVGILRFSVLENPASRIHKINISLGQPFHKFQPYEYAGWDPNPEKSQYAKHTWLWGRFKLPEKKPLPCLMSGMQRHSQWGGKSEKTKEMRSVTPMGFAYAFCAVNQ